MECRPWKLQVKSESLWIDLSPSRHAIIRMSVSKLGFEDILVSPAFFRGGFAVEFEMRRESGAVMQARLRGPSDIPGACISSALWAGSPRSLGDLSKSSFLYPHTRFEPPGFYHRLSVFYIPFSS